MEIQGEVEAHHKLLDGMALDMNSARNVLAGTMGKFKEVMAHKGNRNMTYSVGGIVGFFLILYLAFGRSSCAPTAPAPGLPAALAGAGGLTARRCTRAPAPGR